MYNLHPEVFRILKTKAVERLKSDDHHTDAKSACKKRFSSVRFTIVSLMNNFLQAIQRASPGMNLNVDLAAPGGKVEYNGLFEYARNKRLQKCRPSLSFPRCDYGQILHRILNCINHQYTFLYTDIM